MTGSHTQVAVADLSVHVVTAGDPSRRPVVFLHGWPESWSAWQAVMAYASDAAYAVALDLPGIGQSAGRTDGSKRALAEAVHDVVEQLELRDPVIVGHDIGGMVAYAYVRAYAPSAAVVMNVVVPGLDPWGAVLSNPRIWHFGFHQVPRLPERLVQDHRRDYFDFFFDALARDPSKIGAAARDEYAAAYAGSDALSAGFDWYRAFDQDVQDNQSAGGHDVGTSVLYLRGEFDQGADPEAYADGLRKAGVARVQHGIIPGSGHFSPEEAPEETWNAVAAWLG